MECPWSARILQFGIVKRCGNDNRNELIWERAMDGRPFRSCTFQIISIALVQESSFMYLPDMLTHSKGDPRTTVNLKPHLDEISNWPFLGVIFHAAWSQRCMLSFHLHSWEWFRIQRLYALINATKQPTLVVNTLLDLQEAWQHHLDTQIHV